MEANMSEKKGITRRQFIRNTSAAAIGSTLLIGKPLDIFPAPVEAKGATVVLVRNNDVLDADGKPKFQVILEMLDSAVTTLTGKPDAVSAWKTFIKPQDVVGIKTNVWRYISTTSEVEQALKKRVLDAGVKESNVSIDDRGVLSNPVFEKATALINARPMRFHLWSGVGTLIKNYIMFSPNPSSYHPDSCADLAKLWELPIAKGKTRLNVLVMLTPLFHGAAPAGYNPNYVWKYNGLLVGFDPVAVDSTGLRIIEAKRREFFKEDSPLNPPAKHIALADTRHHLGTADPAKIKLVKIGFDKDSFV
jgi:hypothetical protein